MRARLFFAAQVLVIATCILMISTKATGAVVLIMGWMK